MHQPYPRISYALSALAMFGLFWPYPVTVFIAACLSCLTLPVYKYLLKKSLAWQKERAGKSGRMNSVMLGLARSFPVTAYTTFLLVCLFTPVLTLVVLVSPQAMEGLNRLRELKASNFQLPPHWLEYFDSIKKFISEYPAIEKSVNEALANMDSLVTNAVGMLVSRSFGFVGSTMNVFWLLFLFFTLTIIFTVHSSLIHKVTNRILNLSQPILDRFIVAVYKALKAVTLGILLVAIIQGTLCGIGFAVAGINQPAFWGMLATMVAPIPMVGTALVWLPLCISLWFTGKTMAAVGLALWGALFISGIDNVLRPFFLRQGIKAPIFVLILAILCGLGAFGPIGLIAGPVLLAIALQAYEEGNRFYRVKLESE